MIEFKRPRIEEGEVFHRFFLDYLSRGNSIIPYVTLLQLYANSLSKNISDITGISGVKIDSKLSGFIIIHPMSFSDIETLCVEALYLEKGSRFNGRDVMDYLEYVMDNTKYSGISLTSVTSSITRLAKKNNFIEKLTILVKKVE